MERRSNCCSRSVINFSVQTLVLQQIPPGRDLSMARGNNRRDFDPGRISGPDNELQVFQALVQKQKTILDPPEKRMTIENTHPAIIGQDTWEIVQKNRERQKQLMRHDEIALFSGLVVCSDCGKQLCHSRATSLKHEQERYTCGTYRRYRDQCSAHYIRVVVLEALVLQNLQRVVAYAREDEDEFVRRVMANKLAAQRTEQEQSKRKLEKKKRRVTELDAIIQRLYEDNVTGKLTDERFTKPSAAHEQEQAELKQSVESLSALVEAAETQAVNIRNFLKIVKKYTEPTELTPQLLHEFVEKIVVHEADKSSGHRVQQIDVYYNFIGEIEFPRNIAVKKK